MEARFFSKNFEINLRYSDEDLIGNIIFDTGYENPIKEHLFVYNKNNACSNESLRKRTCLPNHCINGD